MAERDEFDELLAELAGSPAKPAAPSKPSDSAISTSARPRAAPKPAASGDDIDDLLEELGGLEGLGGEEESSKVVAAPAAAPSAVPFDKSLEHHSSGLGFKTGNDKCSSVYIGGEDDKVGMTAGIQRRCCSNLRCLSCDFTVYAFPRRAWDSTAEYMFFRNYMPDKLKMMGKLRPAKGSVAYACQCSWTTVKELTAIKSLPLHRWVCGGHDEDMAKEWVELGDMYPQTNTATQRAGSD